MFNDTAFYDRLRRGKLLGPTLDTEEFQGTQQLLQYGMKRNLKAAEMAYILATAYHETAGRMVPVREKGGNGYFFRLYDPKGARPALAIRNGQRPGDGIIFYGRGTVQITWRGNYARIGRLIGIDLETKPDMALLPEVATQITVDGMINGWFTGVGFTKLNRNRAGRVGRAQFEDWRRIVNGTDKKSQIATYALSLQDDLIASGWPS